MSDAAAPGGGKAAARARAAAQEAALSVSLQKFKRGGQASKPCLVHEGGGLADAPPPRQVATAGIKDRKLKGQLNASERLARDAALSAAKVRFSAAKTCGGCGGRAHSSCAAQTEQWLLPAEAGFLEAEGMERTYRFSQEALASSADATSSRKAFDLSLPELGPYCLDYTPNGRHVLLGGRKGHLAVVDWAKPRLTTEIQVRYRCSSAQCTRRPKRLRRCSRRCERRCAPSSSCTTPTSLLRPKKSACGLEALRRPEF